MMERKGQKTPFVFVFLLGFWPLLGLLDLVKNWVAARYACREFDWAISLSFIAFYTVAWLAISYLIYLAFRYFERRPWQQQIPIQLLLSMLFGIIHTLLLSVMFSYMLYDPDSAESGFWQYYLLRSESRFVPSALNSMITYWVAIILLSAFSYYEKYREQSLRSLTLEAELTSTHLQALRMQIQPHFLFNAHNTIAMLIRNGQSQTAVNMVTGLSDLLRTTLTRDGQQLIPLTEEFALLRKYLDIEKTRFEDRLTVEMQCTAPTEKALVPSLILQPIVENAFKHGIAKLMSESAIKVTGSRQVDQLLITVYNSGPQLPEGWKLSDNLGVGLSNVLNRLKGLYGDDYQFEISNRTGGVEVEIKFPFSTDRK